MAQIFFLRKFDGRLRGFDLVFMPLSIFVSKKRLQPMTTVSTRSFDYSKKFKSVCEKNYSLPGFNQSFRAHSSHKPLKYSRGNFTKHTVQEALQHCLKLVKTRDYCNYIGALLHPAASQPALFALLAFNVEVAVIRDQIRRNSGVTGIYRLQFWKDTIEAIYVKQDAPLPRQPVATALAVYLGDSDYELLTELVASRQHTLGDRAFETLSDLCEYGQRTTGTLLKLMIDELCRNAASCARYEDSCLKKCYEAAESMGAAVGTVTVIRSVIPLLERGIILLPTDLMRKYNISVGRLVTDKNLTSLLRDLANTAELQLSNSRKLKDVIPKEFRLPLMASGATVDFVLSVLKASNYNLLDSRLQRNPELLAWRLWWRKLNKTY